MKSREKLLGSALVLAAGKTLLAVELYQLDFQSPEVGTYNTDFGSPAIQSSVGPLNNALVFHAVTNFDQISLPIDVVTPVYNISFDVLTHNLMNSQYAFSMLLATPEVRQISFHGLFNAIDVWTLGRISPFLDDQVYHLELLVDFPANRLFIDINGEQSFTTTIDAAGLDSIVFRLPPWILGASDGPGTYAALDNIIVTAVPEPSLSLLFVTALLILIADAVYKTKTKGRTRIQQQVNLRFF